MPFGSEVASSRRCRHPIRLYQLVQCPRGIRGGQGRRRSPQQRRRLAIRRPSLDPGIGAFLASDSFRRFARRHLASPDFAPITGRDGAQTFSLTNLELHSRRLHESQKVPFPPRFRRVFTRTTPPTLAPNPPPSQIPLPLSPSLSAD